MIFLLGSVLTVISVCTDLWNAHPQSHLLGFWCRIYFTSSVSPDHSGGGPSPTVTHPHLLHLAGSLMQNEALTLYQSVKALLAITTISWTQPRLHSFMFLLNLFTWWLQWDYIFKLIPIINERGWLSVLCCYDFYHGLLWIFPLIAFKGVTREQRDKHREDKQGCDRESCE